MKHTAMACVRAPICRLRDADLRKGRGIRDGAIPAQPRGIRQVFNEVKNWVYRTGDQLGAANLTVVSSAHPPLTEKALDNPRPLGRTMNKGTNATDTYSVS